LLIFSQIFLDFVEKVFGSVYTLSNSQRRFAVRRCYAIPKGLRSNGPAAWRSGGETQRLERAANFQNPTKQSASHTPTDAKPLVICWHLFLYFTIIDSQR
jgi:hypothetical protein